MTRSYASITELEIFMMHNVIINYFRKLKIIICITFFPEVTYKSWHTYFSRVFIKDFIK